MPVISGLVQGSVVGTGLFTVFIDTLLRRIPFRSVSFADDVKFFADVITSAIARKGSDGIDIVEQWSIEYYDMSFSVEKASLCSVENVSPNILILF